jgi:hypothetical protein
MTNYFEVQAGIKRENENGKVKKITENYLVDALSFTEADARSHEELTAMGGMEFKIRKISKSRVAEVIPAESGEAFYKGKVVYITIDEESGKEKRSAQLVIVPADSVDEADERIREAFKDCIADFDVLAVGVTNIIEVWSYVAQEKSINPHDDEDQDFGVGEEDED